MYIFIFPASVFEINSQIKRLTNREFWFPLGVYEFHRCGFYFIFEIGEYNRQFLKFICTEEGYLLHGSLETTRNL